MNILIDGQTLHTPEINRGIGTYFKEMIESMLRNDFVNIFYITIDDKEKLSYLSTFAKDKLITVIDVYFNPKSLLDKDIALATDTYSELIYACCQKNFIDIYWNPNPQMDNTILPRKSKDIQFTATIYDLIPYVMKDIYFSTWSEVIQKTYINKMNILKDYDHLFPISKSTKNDTIDLIGIADKKQTVTFCGVNEKFKPYPFPKVVAIEQYILYIGGFDPRKNMFRAIDAFAFFMSKYNTYNIDYKLYLVCHLDKEAKEKLFAYARNKKIVESLVLTGFLEEYELLKIYQKARCFFFPSLYEGFGLPILEALGSGLPVACADNSSLVEVAKEYAYYFNAYDIDEMALSLKKTLEKNINLEGRVERAKYASEYRWDKPAKIVLETFSSFNRKENKKENKKIAWVSPLPPERSGISNYSKTLLLAMSDKIDIDIYYDKVIPENILTERFQIFTLKELSEKFHIYDEVIYHLGNNTEFHRNIYKYAWNYPSTVVIHDWNIHPFMQDAFLETMDSHYYTDAMNIYGGQVEEKENINVHDLPMSDAIVMRSKRVIVHHQWVREQLIDKSHVSVIPLFSNIEREPTTDNIISFKEKYNILKKDFIISIFGDINMNKLPDIVIESIRILIDKGYPIKCIFAGKIQDDTRYLFISLESTYYEDKIIATNYLENDEYYSCLYASDLIINLRNPSMGEASLTMAEALYAKKPVIIGDLNQYKEFPDEVVAGKVRYDGSEVEQLCKIIEKIFGDKNLKQMIEVKAKEYSDRILNVKDVLQKYK